MARKLGLSELKRFNISLQLADHSIRYSMGIIENVLIKVQKLIIPIDFVVLDMEKDLFWVDHFWQQQVQSLMLSEVN